jgi:hypothetical protein
VIIGQWSTRALGEFRPSDNDVVVFLANGTGWCYGFDSGSWYSDTFLWSTNSNGSLRIEGKIHESNEVELTESGQVESPMHFEELSYRVESDSSGKRLAFSSSLKGNHTRYGLEEPDVPDLEKPMTPEERVHELIKLLHWYTPKSFVEAAISELLHTDEEYLPLLIQPLGKAYWDNAALVLSRMDDKRLETVIPGMIEWIADLNWPGAIQIQELLLQIGEPVVHFLGEYLLGTDEMLVYYILLMLDHWPWNYVVPLQHVLAEVAVGRFEENAEIAASILRKHSL